MRLPFSAAASVLLPPLLLPGPEVLPLWDRVARMYS